MSRQALYRIFWMLLMLFVCPGLTIGWARGEPSAGNPTTRASKRSPYVSLGPLIVKGMPKVQVQRKMRLHQGRLVQLFLKHFANKNPGAAGVVRLKWLVNAAGKVPFVKVIPPRSALGETFERELMSIFRRMSFRRHLPCGVAVITSTFHFRMVRPTKKPA